MAWLGLLDPYAKIINGPLGPQPQVGHSVRDEFHQFKRGVRRHLAGSIQCISQLVQVQMRIAPLPVV